MAHPRAIRPGEYPWHTRARSDRASTRGTPARDPTGRVPVAHLHAIRPGEYPWHTCARSVRASTRVTPARGPTGLGPRGSESTGPRCQLSARSWPAAPPGRPSHWVPPAGLSLAVRCAGAVALSSVTSVVRPHSSGQDRRTASWWLLGHARAGLLSTGDSWWLLRRGLWGRFPLLLLSHFRHYCQCALRTLVVPSQC